MRGVRLGYASGVMKVLFLALLLLVFSPACSRALKEEYRVEKETPVETLSILKINGESLNGFYASCVNFSFLNPENERIEYSLDGGRFWNIYNGPVEVCGSVSILYRGISSKGISIPKLAVINIDRRPPEILPVIEPSPNSEGWNNTEVTVSFICRDAESGIKECPPPVRIFEEGNNQVINVKAMDRAGNESSLELSINVDKTPPSISITDILDGGTYFLCDRPSGDYRVEDNLSGVKESTVLTESGRSVGKFKYTVKAIDRAGNRREETRNYSVIYRFEGFSFPLIYKKPFRQGSVVPVRFRLSDGCGNRITEALARFNIELFSKIVPEGQPEELVDEPIFGDKGDLFIYDYMRDEYVYNLSTESLFPGTWRITVYLDDGRSYSELIAVK